MAPLNPGLNVERVVLRAAIGDRNYGSVERLAALLDELARGGALTEEGVGNVISTLADEMVVAAVARACGADLSAGRASADTPPLEDPA